MYFKKPRWTAREECHPQLTSGLRIHTYVQHTCSCSYNPENAYAHRKHMTQLPPPTLSTWKRGWPVLGFSLLSLEMNTEKEELTHSAGGFGSTGSVLRLDLGTLLTTQPSHCLLPWPLLYVPGSHTTPPLFTGMPVLRGVKSHLHPAL